MYMGDDIATLKVLLENLDTQYKAELQQVYMFGGAALAAGALYFFPKIRLAALAAIPLGYVAYQKWEAAQRIRVDRDTVNMKVVLR